MTLLRKWSEAAILGQPLDYLHAVWLDTIRLVDPNHRSYGEQSADKLITYLINGPDPHKNVNEFVISWQSPLYPGDPAAHRGEIGPLREWERITRVDGVWMVILLALCLAGPWLTVGRARAGTTLFAATALALLFFPILAHGYEFRYVVPAFGPLLAAGALAGWGLAVRLRPARAPTLRPDRRPLPVPTEPPPAAGLQRPVPSPPRQKMGPVRIDRCAEQVSSRAGQASRTATGARLSTQPSIVVGALARPGRRREGARGRRV